MTVPKRVVGQYETAGAHHAQCHLVGFQIGTLVAVDERHVELYSQFGSLRDGIADDEVDALAIGSVFQPLSRKILHFIVDFESPHPAVILQSLGHADG